MELATAAYVYNSSKVLIITSLDQLERERETFSCIRLDQQQPIVDGGRGEGSQEPSFPRQAVLAGEGG